VLAVLLTRRCRGARFSLRRAVQHERQSEVTAMFPGMQDPHTRERCKCATSAPDCLIAPREREGDFDEQRGQNPCSFNRDDARLSLSLSLSLSSPPPLIYLSFSLSVSLRLSVSIFLSYGITSSYTGCLLSNQCCKVLIYAYIHSWKFYVKLNIFHVFQTVEIFVH